MTKPFKACVHAYGEIKFKLPFRYLNWERLRLSSKLVQTQTNNEETRRVGANGRALTNKHVMRQMPTRQQASESSTEYQSNALPSH